MKQLTLLISLLCCCSVSIAQNKYFEKSLNWEYYVHEGRQVCVINNNDYVLLGHVLPYNASYVNSFFAKITINGEATSPIYYSQNTANYYAADLLANELGYGILVNKDPDNYGSLPSYPVFLQVDSLGNVLYTHETVDTINYKVVEQMVRTPEDGGYLAVGRVVVNNVGRHKPYLIKLSANGTKQWEKIINNYTPSLDSRLYDVVRNQEGYFTVGMINSDTKIEIGVGDIILAQIDITDGHFTNEWVYHDFDGCYGSNTSYWDYRLTTLNDGGFVIGGGKETSPQYGYLIRLDSNKNVVWFDDSVNHNCSVRVMRPLPDGSFVTTGCATVLYPEVSDGVQVEISKVSSSGVLLWKRHYGVDGRDDYAWGMTNTPDGGFMVVGRTYDFATQQVPIYLLKTNCMGLLTEPQAAFAAQIDTNALTATFQNLSQFVYPDSIDGGHYIWDFGDGTTSTQINPTHTYAQGANYTVTLTAVVCSDTSVFVQNVSTWAVGIEASPPPPPKEGEMQVLPLEGGLEGGLYTVLPNPAQDYLVISSQTSATNATFVLYDVLGREQLRQNLSSPSFGGDKGEAIIATEHLPSGIYLYQIINPQNQTLQHGKLSILH